MIAWLLTIPLEVRTLAVFVLGLAIGGQINRGIYRLAYHRRAIGPWSKPHSAAPPRTWWDRLPVIGWIGLARESPIHGRGYWVRPLLIEFCFGVGLAVIYWLEVHALLIGGPLLFPLNLAAPAVQAIMHERFVSHAALLSLLMVATFIDFDEKTIPDSITIPGTLAGLMFAAIWPVSLSTILFPPPGPPALIPLLVTTLPAFWPSWLNGAEGLSMGLALLLVWCFAVQHKVWTLRRGWAKAFHYLCASMSRSLLMPAVFVITAPFVALIWWWGGIYWEGLLSSLVGMAFGGGLVWAVRIIGKSALGQEAMGFGDVTLMAMIGAFFGWQAALIVFFVAPFAAIFIAMAQWIITRRRDIAFGPYLCVGAVYVLVQWPAVWARIALTFLMLGWFIPLVIVVCLGLMWIMLVGIRWLKGDA